MPLFSLGPVELNWATKRAKNMHQVMFDDDGPDNAVSHFTAVAALFIVMVSEMKREFPVRNEQVCNSIYDWLHAHHLKKEDLN